jgi:TPR repeat protein
MYEKSIADLAFMEGDFERAAEMYLEGARNGDALASFNYGYCLWRGIGAPYDPKEAKSFFAFA